MNNNDHYVPQSILRNFHNVDSRLHVFDKWHEREFVSSTRNVASEKGFYDLPTDGETIPFEPVLTEVENHALNPIASIIGSRSLNALSDDDRQHVAFFLAVQMMRTRAARDTLAQMDSGLRAVLPNKNLTESQMPEGIFFADDDELKSTSISHLSIAEQIYPHLLTKVWCLNAPADGTFYISDNPFVKRNLNPPHPMMGNGGISSPGIQMYMPLTPTLTLGLFCPTIIEPFYEHKRKNPKLDIPLIDSISSGTAFEIPSESVTYCNSLQVAHSTRFVFSSDGDFSLPLQMVNDNPELKKPTHVVVQ